MLLLLHFRWHVEQVLDLLALPLQFLLIQHLLLHPLLGLHSDLLLLYCLCCEVAVALWWCVAVVVFLFDDGLVHLF
jgi:hypothetical protein